MRFCILPYRIRLTNREETACRPCNGEEASASKVRIHGTHQADITSSSSFLRKYN
jgi:hypothetical protein